MLTVMGGAWSGRKLKAPDRPELRPTLGRIKSAIFSIVESIEWKRSGSPDFSEWRCLDLFAGVGSLGIEILSRGAAHCVFVEREKAHARLLQENLKSLDAISSAKIIVAPAEKTGWETSGPFHLALLDPPYAHSELPEILLRLAQAGVMNSGGIIVFEHDPKVKQALIPGLSLHSHRVLGPAGITVLIRD